MTGRQWFAVVLAGMAAVAMICQMPLFVFVSTIGQSVPL